MSDLARPLPMSLPSVMRRLGMLEEAGRVTSRKAGRVRTCQIAPQALGQAQAWIDSRRAEWEPRLDRLDALAVASA